MATISFHGMGPLVEIDTSSGSGVGFYGPNFGDAVSVSAFNQSTYITSSDGTSQGAQLNSIAWLNSASGTLNNTGSGTYLNRIPNYQSVINPRFTHASSVTVTNVKFRAYDRVNINNDPSGVSVYVAECRHPGLLQTELGSGSTAWTQIYGSGSIFTMSTSPSTSGLMVGNGSQGISDVRHDWYLLITTSPTTVGSKTFSGYLSLEYL